MWQAVILQDDGLFGLLKHPVKSGRNAAAASQIRGCKIARNRTVPTHVVKERADCFTLVSIFRAIRPWAVCYDHELLGPHCSNRVQHLCSVAWAIENNQCYGYRKLVLHEWVPSIRAVVDSS